MAGAIPANEAAQAARVSLCEYGVVGVGRSLSAPTERCCRNAGIWRAIHAPMAAASATGCRWVPMIGIEVLARLTAPRYATAVRPRSRPASEHSVVRIGISFAADIHRRYAHPTNPSAYRRIRNERVGTPVCFILCHVRSMDSVSYTHLTLPTMSLVCRSRWSPYH